MSDAAMWEPVVRARAHELVIQAIEDQITSGALRVADPLPPERELAARLGVSRAGVREAVRVLEGQGVLRSRVGSGAEAGTFVAALPDAALTRFLRLHVALANFPMSDVIAARIALERTSAALAAAHATEAALDGIAALVERMDDPALDRAAFNAADAELHIAIAQASGNRLVASLAVAIRGALRDPLLRAIESAGGWDETAADLQRQHHGILDALRGGDGARAADLMEQHIRYAEAALALA
ncbi:FadR/GntR family transcriptional regulator [Microbacterium sp. SORGH_AS_0888]|uniref:FadR/GntR family transcriptional regulator n=1 Tax=Microbacterium sp. SORGH_AS_0888 TaxID=3041791 RepID=UPI00277DD00B|nr:FCD domain-containing protein [Microbacterium sp. SORGH_AS_0888]MDQ1131355.1 GntR family transcriptional repressor for pyruvate dehydrogenase complex [Microbacterium sp. SORGH_AS_0888]